MAENETQDALTNWQAVDLHRVLLAKLFELTLKEVDEDLAMIAAEADRPSFESLVARAKWHKKIDLYFEVNRVFDRRYGSKRGELRLVQEQFGEQLNLPDDITAEDVQKRLDWYARKASNDYARAVRDTISAHSITSPIEQIFLMEWTSQNVADRFRAKLQPQCLVEVEKRQYTIDFVVTQQRTGKRIAVELDGHDFHEKTAAQARADKERERAIIRQGYTLLRFTGSEVVRKSRECVEEVVALLEPI